MSIGDHLRRIVGGNEVIEVVVVDPVTGTPKGNSYRRAVGAQPVGGVTPADAVLAEASDAIRIGGAGDIVVRFAGDAADTTLTVVAGELLPISVTAVRSAGTTATGIVALYY